MVAMLTQTRILLDHSLLFEIKEWVVAGGLLGKAGLDICVIRWERLAL